MDWNIKDMSSIVTTITVVQNCFSITYTGNWSV